MVFLPSGQHQKQDQAKAQSNMKKLPWASWKFWNRVPVSPKRRVHLGIDYGTSMSKMVFRDSAPAGGERAVLVLHNGSVRIPSRVCMTATELLFGDDTKSSADCVIYDSLKMRVAVEVSGDPKYFVGPEITLPNGFTAVDLAALTVWYLISEGQRAIAVNCDGRIEGVEMRMSMGVPMAFFDNRQLRAAFLSIANRAWTFYCNEGLIDSALLLGKARRVLEKYPVVPSTISDQEVEDWIENRTLVSVNSPIDIIRSEDEAAIWWLLRSPGVRAGPYAKVDIGAGTTQANLFRIFGTAQTVRRSLVRYGTAAVPVGMDAVDRAISECQGLNSDCLALRGFEQPILQADTRVREALVPVGKQIYDSCRKAWSEACSKMGSNALELSSWRQQKVFVTGGGSRLPSLVDTVRMHPDQREPLSVMTLEQPTDLIRPDHREMTSDELPFVTVAYGLSNIKSFLPNPYSRDPGSFSFGRH
jgi:hypothetical protein